MKIFLNSIFIFLVAISMKLSAGNAVDPARQHHRLQNDEDSLVPVSGQQYGVVYSAKRNVRYNGREILLPGKPLGEWIFKNTPLGGIPENWEDILYRQPSRNWMVDEKGFLHHMLKNRNNRYAYDPFSDDFKESPTTETRPGLIALKGDQFPVNFRVRTSFKKTEDADVFYGVAGRIVSKGNFYAVLLTGDCRLQIVKVKNDKQLLLSELVLLSRYKYPEEWQIEVSFYDDLITGLVYNRQGKLLGRADARDGEFNTGSCGIYATDYAAASAFKVTAVSAPQVVQQKENIFKTDAAPLYRYPLIQPVQHPEALNSTIGDIKDQYDVVIAGAGTGGWAAAVEAVRLGSSVLLLEETDWIGGQMTAAAVSSMDESGPLVRERGIYREFHESMVNYYYGKDKCPFMAYYWGRNAQNQQEGGYEPLVARNVLYGFIKDAKEKALQKNPHGRLDVLLRTKVNKVHKTGNKVTGINLMQWNEESGEKEKRVSCKVLVDATEYGDVIPLTGAPYRVGNTKSKEHNLKGIVQDHTYTGVIREYPEGVPEHLKMKTPPPRYDVYRKKFQGRILNGDWLLHNGARMYRAELAWRGMADSYSPLSGKTSQLRHTLTGLNGGNDYPVSVATIESADQRLQDEKDGIYRTLAKIYYLQNELNAPWSVAEDQQFNTSYNRYMMKKRGVPEPFLDIAKYMPQIPYVRESRRIEGMVMLVAKDLERWEKAKHVPTSVAVGDYFMDLHGTYNAYERDLDDSTYARGGGPFQLPFEAFIPKSLDGFLAAEKNFSQSRLVNGATRLQPITMLTGQAVGAIAALAAQKGVQPRKLRPLDAQLLLLDAGSTLIPRWYKDISWGTELWKATQLLSLYKIMDKPGELDYWDGMEFAPKQEWGVNQLLTKGVAIEVLQKLARLLGYKVKQVANTGYGEPVTSVASLQKIAGSVSASFSNTPGFKVAEGAGLVQADLAKYCLALIQQQ